jgi:dipeptidyl aminopeptidase/acylaminoacyl peptidase
MMHRLRLRRGRAVPIIAVCVGWLLNSTSATLHAQGLTPERVASIQQIETVAMSPDGARVAFILEIPRTEDESPGRAHTELHVVPVAGGEPTAIVRAPRDADTPRWSPDGATLAFVARLGEDSREQVYAVPREGGEPTLLLRLSHDVMDFAWSPDGRSIAYTAREPEPQELVERRERGDDVEVADENVRHVRLWVADLESGEIRPVTPGDQTVRAFAWKPDGKAFAVQMTEGADVDAGYMFRRIYTLQAGGGDPKLLTETKGKLGEMAWSPKGERLAFLGAVSLNDPLAQSVFVAPSAGGAAVNRTPGFEGSALSVGWLDDATVVFVAAEGTRTTLNRVGATTGTIERLAGNGAEVFTDASFDARARRFAVAAGSAAQPAEVFTGRIGDDRLTRLTKHNAWLSEVELARQETVEWAGADGWRIQGVLIHPLGEVDGRRYPLAILPHGGPEGITYDGWTTRALYPAQVLAARGYAVLMPNYRGSGGRGVRFAKADHRDLGGKEFVDVVAGIDHLAEMGLVDPNRVGISGTSYGGYFSAWGATRYSERFRAAITFAGISNWVSFTGTTDIPYEMSIVHWDTWWFNDPGLAWDRSPLAWINTTKTATLVAHGLADTRVHPEQSIELYTALRIKGIPSGLVLYPREPHGLRERAHQLDFMGRVLDWFDTHVKEAVTSTE